MIFCHSAQSYRYLPAQHSRCQFTTALYRCPWAGRKQILYVFTTCFNLCRQGGGLRWLLHLTLDCSLTISVIGYSFRNHQRRLSILASIYSLALWCSCCFYPPCSFVDLLVYRIYPPCPACPDAIPYYSSSLVRAKITVMSISIFSESVVCALSRLFIALRLVLLLAS